MKNDLEILYEIKDELTKVDKPPLDPSLIELYGKLVERVPEEGFELLVADKDISVAEEQALRLLSRWEYIAFDFRYHTGDGYYYRVNMRGKRFFELANSQVCSVAVGMKDTGKRETFETGAVRDCDEGKPRPDLFSAFAMERIGLWMEQGARKYEPRNWEKGMSYVRVVASLYRHLMKYMQNDRSEDHLAAISVNSSFLMHYDAMIERGVLPASLNDLPSYEPIPSAHRNGDESFES
ncbi:MAG: DUF5664 domain-containing protein [Planctomycetaceae bacterium]|nr:DUF5664 domain-containing protein [Planctomycetaceae bacterium]